jgi:pimeloyl-ACP methyl ester carboxylesterase
MRSIVATILLIHLFLTTACNNSEHKSSMLKVKKYKEGFVESDKVKLQYLDWAGDGQVPVLICGLGDTPFLFEDLAGQLSSHYRVIGYSRRNHGKSESKDDKYDNATLVSDLKLLLDSLEIDKANLLGWSMGGNEITEFASLYPDRVGKLIYFEAGYDLSDGGFEKLVSNIPKSYLPDSSDMKSLDDYRRWYHHFWFGDVEWNDALEANLRASIDINADGSIKTIPNDEVFKSTLSEVMNYKRSYLDIKVPSLVIYSKRFFHPADDNSETIKLYDSIENNIVSPWRSANKKRMDEELQNATIVEAPSGTHVSFLFLSKDFLVRTIDSFLNEKT